MPSAEVTRAWTCCGVDAPSERVSRTIADVQAAHVAGRGLASARRSCRSRCRRRWTSCGSSSRCRGRRPRQGSAAPLAPTTPLAVVPPPAPVYFSSLRLVVSGLIFGSLKYRVVWVTVLSKFRSAVTSTAELPGPTMRVSTSPTEPCIRSSKPLTCWARVSATESRPSPAAESTRARRVGDGDLLGVEALDAGGDQVHDRLHLLGAERRAGVGVRRAPRRWSASCRWRTAPPAASPRARRRCRRSRAPRWCAGARPRWPACSWSAPGTARSRGSACRGSRSRRSPGWAGPRR